MNTQRIREAIMVIATVGEAIRDLTQAKGGVPSGELYAFLMDKGMGIHDYNTVILKLKEAGLVKETNYWLEWIGPAPTKEATDGTKATD